MTARSSDWVDATTSSELEPLGQCTLCTTPSAVLRRQPSLTQVLLPAAPLGGTVRFPTADRPDRPVTPSRSNRLLARREAGVVSRHHRDRGMRAQRATAAVAVIALVANAGGGSGATDFHDSEVLAASVRETLSWNLSQGG